MCSWKRFPWDYIIKLRDKSFESIDFDLAKYALVSPPTHSWTGWVNFGWSGSYEITINVFTVVIMYSYLFDSTKHNTLQLI